jgi:hypothetical protein
MSQIVEWAFGKRMTPAERLRKHQRALDRTQRELDRERVKLENQEKKLVQDIKKSAKNGQVGACKIQAKDLVRTRRSVSLDCSLIAAALADWMAKTDTFRSSIKCAPNYRLFPYAFRYAQAVLRYSSDSAMR